MSVQPVTNTSGSGFRFEDYFGAYLATAMLADHGILGHEFGLPVRVDFQVVADGWQLDDALVTFSSNARTSRWCVSVKSGSYLGATAPADLVSAMWAEYLGSTRSGFDKNQDVLGLAVAPTSPTAFSDLQALIRLSRQQTAVDLARRAAEPGYISASRRGLWDSFAAPSHLGLSADDEGSPARILERFRCLQLDFDLSPSTDVAKAVIACADVLIDSGRAEELWSFLLVQVAEIRTGGGYFDQPRLADLLEGRFELRGDRLRRVRTATRLHARCEARLIERWRAADVSEILSRDFAGNRSIGQLVKTVPPSGVVLLRGEFGSGKSVAAERVHQSDIDEFSGDTNAPIPVYLRSRDVRNGLEAAIQAALPAGIAVDSCGIRVVIDGLEEPGLLKAAEILEEVRELAGLSGNNRFLLSSRPWHGLRDEECIDMQPLSDQNLYELSEAITGQKYALYNVPAPVQDAVRWPLFALIALGRKSRAAELPSSRALLIDALVKDSLGRERYEIMASTSVLARAATASIEGGGYFSLTDLGNPQLTVAVVATRLVSEDSLGFRFALPVIEQYFAAYALLEDYVDRGSIHADLGRFERWRYAFVIASGIGSADKVDTLIAELGSSWPGAAVWLIKETVSTNIAALTTPGAVPLDALACGRRIRRSLTSLLEWFNHQQILSDVRAEDGSLLTLGVIARNDWVTLGFVRNVKENVLQLPPDASPISRENSAGLDYIPARGGRVPSREPAWPWKWAVDMLGRSVEKLMSSRALTVDGLEPLAAERTWLLARNLVNSRALPHVVVDAGDACREAENMLSHMGTDDRSQISFDSSKVFFRRDELVEFIARYSGTVDAILPPFPGPDIEGRVRWIWESYSPSRALELLEYVYAGALRIYKGLVDYWFAGMMQTLNLSSILPVQSRLYFWPQSGPSYEEQPVIVHFMEAVSSWGEAGATAEIARARPNLMSWGSEEFSRELDSRRALRPNSLVWSNVSVGHVGLANLGSTPATDLAYEWLWDDLYQIGLLSSRPPVQ